MATAQQPTLVLTDTRSNIFTICFKKVGDSPGLFLFIYLKFCLNAVIIYGVF